MANSLGLLGRQLKELWSHFGVNQKVSTILALLLVGGLSAGILLWSSRPSYSLLYAGMDLEDAATAREKLTEERIVVEVRDSGHSLYVASGDVYRARLLLASSGLPKKSSSGFELFEQPKFGLTDFAQRVNYQRALQGELERTISSMEGIASARVMVVLPSDKLFASANEKKASASIMLNIGGGGSISAVQVRSIKQLVGSSVPGLNAAAITVSDQSGRMLSKSQVDDGAESGVASDQMEVQQKYEKMLADKAQSMLDTALGMGRSIVQVSVAMDFSKIEKKTEKYDSDNRVVISEKIKSESSSAPGAALSAGVVATVPINNPNQVSVGNSESKTKSEDISTEYKVPADVEHIVQQGARVKGISVSVCVAQGDAARSDDELKRIQELVKSALGLVDAGDRKDSIEVAEMKFAETVPAAQPGFLDKLPVAPGVLLNAVGGVALLIIVVVMSRRISSRLTVTSEETGIQVANLAVGGAAGGARSVGDLGMGDEAPENTLDYLTRLAEHNPKAIATWINNVSRAHK